MPGLLVSAVSLAVVLYLANPRELVKALRLADYRLVALAVAISGVWLLVRAVVWRTLLQEKATFRQVFLTVNEGYLLNNILPFRLGEVGRAFLLGRKAGLGFWQVLSSILIERILDLAMAAGLLLSTLPFVVGATWAREAALGAGLIVLAGLLVLYLLARYREWAIARFQQIGARWPFLLRVAGDRLPAFFNGLAVLTDGSRFLRSVAWMLLNWIVAIVQYYILMLAFLPQARFLWGAFSLGVGALGIAAPSSPGAVGVLELSLVGALSIFGVDPAISLAFAIIAHIINYLLTGIFGAYGLAKDGESLASLYDRVRRMPKNES
ncbi:MAG TPA: lysylphosphatidylglycerol synthase transmembrane domain-containing protein [Anaerolineales bacterium]